MSTALKVKVIVGSVREGRFGIHAAKWIEAHAKAHEGLEVELLDLKEWPLQDYADAMPPSMVKNGAYPSDVAKKWAAKIGEADAYIMVSPEYNRSTSGALKNAIDAVYPEWNNKAVGFVSYGSLGGGRAVEHLRGIAAEVQMADVRTAVHIMAPWSLTDENGLKAGALDSYAQSAETMLQQLTKWGGAFKTMRG